MRAQRLEGRTASEAIDVALGPAGVVPLVANEVAVEGFTVDEVEDPTQEALAAFTAPEIKVWGLLVPRPWHPCLLLGKIGLLYWRSRWCGDSPFWNDIPWAPGGG